MTYERTFDALGPVWDLRNTVPVFLALLIFPLLNFNSTTFFTKFNSLGEYTTLVIFNVPSEYSLNNILSCTPIKDLSLRNISF